MKNPTLIALLLTATQAACTTLADGVPGGGDDGDGPCATGTLYAGDPTYAGSDAPSPTGSPLRGGAPVAWRDVVFAGGAVYTHTGEEIWAAELGAADPQLRRIVGQRQDGLPQFAAGPCASARLANTSGLVVAADGSLIITDHNANGVVRISDPMGAACTVAYLAGNATAGAIRPDEPPHVGLDDGTGAGATFALPGKPAQGEGGTTYVLDHENFAVRAISPAGAVSTVPFTFVEPIDQWNDLAVRGGKLYLVGVHVGSGTSYVVEVDPGTGAYRTLVAGTGEAYPPADPSRSAVISTITTDGDRLFIAGSSRIWQVGLDGHLTHAAGGYDINELTDFPLRGYDPSATYPARELALKHDIADARFAQFLSWHDGALYWSARATSRYVVEIGCAR